MYVVCLLYILFVPLVRDTQTAGAEAIGMQHTLNR